MKIFKVEAQGDTMYIQAPSQLKAQERLEEMCGFIPEELLTWSEVKKLPKGEDFL